ncbi:MAG: hypothetical protein HYR85_25120 [Planctomycetes bacterium]|nr:hypothetical protein [Planctomycetota bacterium]MBI3843299.1 hypothetical protein [Planctomycetota bacterium]
MSARLDVDPALCEAVVEDAARIASQSGIASFERAIRGALDPLYDKTVGDRQPAFETAYRRLFKEWGYEALLTRALDEFPQIFGEGVTAGVSFRAPSRPNESGADLGGPGKVLAGISVPVALFRDPSALARFLRHEIQHLADLLDPAFAYTPDPSQVLGTGTTENAVRDRLRLFWSISVDGRIAARGQLPSRSLEAWAPHVVRVLPEAEPERVRHCTELLWNRGLIPFPELLGMARRPARSLLGAVGNRGFVVGDPCPLCRFPTRRLVDFPQGLLRAKDLAEIREIVRDFDPESGACERCVEGYAVAKTVGA